jgi:hypothetical protein
MAVKFESRDRRPFTSDDDFIIALNRFEAHADAIAKRAIYDGAKIMYEKVKAAIEAIPEEKFRYLRGNDSYRYVTPDEKQDLIESLGITKIEGNEFDGWNAKIGFDGYGSHHTSKYPGGVPNQLIARSLEKGTSVRRKYPFMRRTVNRYRKATKEAMNASVNETCEKLANKQ